MNQATLLSENHFVFCFSHDLISFLSSKAVYVQNDGRVTWADNSQVTHLNRAMQASVLLGRSCAFSGFGQIFPPLLFEMLA
ncbi:hypothetical protein AtNW77_Chr3g0181391 [Arabidopsis thaliana]|uniref:Uncharacterized protein n=2 Tax=Arabidopsis thaliana TaxID=3702 RepID=A0A654F9K0_ARATH|nr:uncharacterized protein AT3G22183 [Arabidopsis thaliana]AEE76601.1 hypothetical protein AT3G22183 [Arabidopsis thaliana]CAA0383287.1 unnamed protein product [Arabidopsis thaliana]VYS58216.1 unnamed protein product [Arabidopsis thaliana]|eukprot:NP_001118674.1 hypothetical protein AT3G22183 [Arabidopsis thaliana]